MVVPTLALRLVVLCAALLGVEVLALRAGVHPSPALAVAFLTAPLVWWALAVMVAFLAARATRLARDGALGPARRHAQLALAADRVGMVGLAPAIHGDLAVGLRRAGRLDDAVTEGWLAVTTGRWVPRRLRVGLMANLGGFLIQSGRLGDAVDVLRSAQALGGSERTREQILNNLGWALALRGDLDEAAQCFAAVPADSQATAAPAACGISEVLLRRGRWDAAVEAADLALSIAERTGNVVSVSQAHENAGRALAAAGHAEAAAARLRAAAAAAWANGDGDREGRALCRLAAVDAGRGRREEAMETLGRAAGLVVSYTSRAALDEARAALETGRHGRA